MSSITFKLPSQPVPLNPVVELGTRRAVVNQNQLDAFQTVTSRAVYQPVREAMIDIVARYPDAQLWVGDYGHSVQCHVNGRVIVLADQHHPRGPVRMGSDEALALLAR
jgi:hypothetical protein